MAPRKPKVGDAAVIDGKPAVIGLVDDTTIEFHCPARQAALALVANIQALPKEEKELAKAEFAMNPTPNGGTRTFASPHQVFWVEFSSVWTCFGRLLSREADSYTPGVDDEGHAIQIPSSIFSRAKVHRIADQPYDPSNEIAHHIMAVGGTDGSV